MNEPLDNYTNEEIKAITTIMRLLSEMTDEERQRTLQELVRKYRHD
jgi:hypothetical protein